MKFRCKECGHQPRRIVSATSKDRQEPRQHKKPCDCACHRKAQS